MTIDIQSEGIYSKENQIQGFIEKISKADGQLIPLPNIKSRLNEPLFISSRFGSDEINPEDNYLNIDIFALRENDYIPVGIYDWEIKEGRANGNKQRHCFLPTYNSAQETAKNFWGNESFQIKGDDFLHYAMVTGGFDSMDKLRKQGFINNEQKWSQSIYRGLGLGSLLVATSALVLEKKGIRFMELGTLSQAAKKVWSNFDRGDKTTLLTREVSQHPKTRATLTKFIA
jgi:hypothetical protein